LGGDISTSKRSVSRQSVGRRFQVDEFVGDERKDVSEALLQYALGNMDFLLAAAKVVPQGCGWIQTQVLAYQVPASLQVFGASSKLEIIDVHTEEQPQPLVYEDAFPSFKRFKPNFGERCMAVLLPKEARQRVSIEGESQRAHRPLEFLPAFGPLIAWKFNPRFSLRDLAIAIKAGLGVCRHSVRLLARHAWQQRDGVHEFGRLYV
jgi:hypothetical protein